VDRRKYIRDESGLRNCKVVNVSGVNDLRVDTMRKTNDSIGPESKKKMQLSGFVFTIADGRLRSV